MDVRSFWYILAQSHEVPRNTVVSRRLLGEQLALFRGADGTIAVLRDRCMHRNAPLSRGEVKCGRLRCPYHGWVYDSTGSVVEVPAEGEQFKSTAGRRAQTFASMEHDDLIYVRLNNDTDSLPYRNPVYQNPSWRTVRLVNHFSANVTNCVENVIDIPHTVFVHKKIFRVQQQRPVQARIVRHNGSVQVTYAGETDNLGWFRRFLNPRNEPIEHRDNYYMPNVTEVEYIFSRRRRLFIISQHVPDDDTHTTMYTDLSYDYGSLGRCPGVARVVRALLRWQGQWVIGQDVDILKQQAGVLEKYGEDFHNTSADAIHVMVASVRDALLSGQDPRLLPRREATVTFWV